MFSLNSVQKFNALFSLDMTQKALRMDSILTSSAFPSHIVCVSIHRRSQAHSCFHTFVRRLLFPIPDTTMAHFSWFFPFFSYCLALFNSLQCLSKCIRKKNSIAPYLSSPALSELLLCLQWTSHMTGGQHCV